MKFRSLIAAFVGTGLFVFALGAAAQNGQEPAKPGMMSQNMMGMMGMTDMMSQMTKQHKDMSDQMNKLMQSMTALQNEKDPAVLKSKLAEHAALVAQMRTRMMQAGDMMQRMSGMMSGTTDAMKKPDEARPQPAPDESGRDAHHAAEPAK